MSIETPRSYSFQELDFFEFQAENLVEEAVKKAQLTHDFIWALYHSLFPA